jgi:hypothetical protein
MECEPKGQNASKDCLSRADHADDLFNMRDVGAKYNRFVAVCTVNDRIQSRLGRQNFREGSRILPQHRVIFGADVNNSMEGGDVPAGCDGCFLKPGG